MVSIMLRIYNSILSFIGSGPSSVRSNVVDGEIKLKDQTTQTLMMYVLNMQGTFTLASNVSIGDRTFTAAADHGITQGSYVVFQQGLRFGQYKVITVATNLITIDSPFDFAYTTSAICTRGSNSLSVNGSTTPVIFEIGPASGSAKWHVSHVKFVLEDNTEMDDAKFGGISALTKGVVLRKADGDTRNYMNVKTNSDFRVYTDDLEYSTKAPSGYYGLSACKRFNGQVNEGVVIELDGALNAKLQIIVQDDLSELTLFHAMVHGHEVD